LTRLHPWLTISSVPPSLKGHAVTWARFFHPWQPGFSPNIKYMLYISFLYPLYSMQYKIITVKYLYLEHLRFISNTPLISIKSIACPSRFPYRNDFKNSWSWTWLSRIYLLGPVFMVPNPNFTPLISKCSQIPRWSI
jgi:hypothetical protein